MLWLTFPKHINIPFFIEQAGTKLDTFEALDDSNAKGSVLVHVVYSTDGPPRAVIHDRTDELFVPVGVRGLSVCESYVLPRRLVDEMLDALPPVSQPGKSQHPRNNKSSK